MDDRYISPDSSLVDSNGDVINIQSENMQGVDELPSIVNINKAQPKKVFKDLMNKL